LKPSAVHVGFRLFKKFLDYFVDFFEQDYDHYESEMFEGRGDRLSVAKARTVYWRGQYSALAELRAQCGAASALASKTASLSGLLPVPKRTEPAPLLERFTKDDGPMWRRSCAIAAGPLAYWRA